MIIKVASMLVTTTALLPPNRKTKTKDQKREPVPHLDTRLHFQKQNDTIFVTKEEVSNCDLVWILYSDQLYQQLPFSLCT